MGGWINIATVKQKYNNCRRSQKGIGSSFCKRAHDRMDASTPALANRSSTAGRATRFMGCLLSLPYSIGGSDEFTRFL